MKPIFLALGLLLLSCGSGSIHQAPLEDASFDVRLGDFEETPDADALADEDEQVPEDSTLNPDVAKDDASPDSSYDSQEPLDSLQEEVANDAVQELEEDDVQEDIEPSWGPFDEVNVESQGTQEPWESVLRLTFDHPGLTADAYSEKTAQIDPSIASLFGTTQPPANTVLLHVGPHCEPPAERVLFFVHGTASDASQTWVSPPVLLGQGHASRFMEQNLCVMAVTFPHPFGDNYNQAIQLAAAVQKARELTHVPGVTLIAHSKGGIAAMAWLTGLATARQLPYEGGVESLLMLGTPLGGMDFSFRHPAFNYPADLLSLRMPSSWDLILEWAQWKDVTPDSIYAAPFRGIAQLTTALDDQYVLSMLEQDWYTTYYGGTGLVSHSQGIAKAIELGDYFMDQLKQHKTPTDLPVSLASGGNSFINGTLWEAAGTADGMVFRTSAEDDSSIGLLNDVHHFPLLNHVDLLTSSDVAQWLEANW